MKNSVWKWQNWCCACSKRQSHMAQNSLVLAMKEFGSGKPRVNTTKNNLSSEIIYNIMNW